MDRLEGIAMNPHIRQIPTPRPITTIEEAREFHLSLVETEPKITIQKEEREDLNVNNQNTE
jgi:hypothetical protein